jgi:purine-binding chemotaxis protein CheW
MGTVAGADMKQFVVFKLGQEEYGVDIQKITTIEQLRQITRVPKTPAFIKGVINLRGDIIPIMDLRKRFSLPHVENTEETRIIISKLEDVFIGFIVDGVAEVLQLAEDSIESIANFSSDLSLDYILGVGKVSDRIVTLLNIEMMVKFEG